MGPVKRTLLAIGRTFQLFEAAAYGLALILGVRWLALRVGGRNQAPDDIERDGLWVAAIALAVLLGGALRLVLRARTLRVNRSSSPPRSSASTSGTSRAGRAASG